MLHESQMLGGLTAAKETRRPMADISRAADRIEFVAANLREVLDRFHGSPATAQSAGSAPPIGISYLSSIERLHGNIDLLEKQIGALAEVA